MSSIAFPASEQAQQEHMGTDPSAEQLYQSVADAVRAPSRASLAIEQNRAPSDAASMDRRPSTTPSTLFDNPNAPTEAPKPKLTKRINARLQLAAALIEADNDRIFEKAQFWHIYHPSRDGDLVRPPPPPQPALASQSAIFAPYREGANLAIKRHVRTWSAATGLSRLLDPDDDGRRPSVDFLGVTLPNEQKARSRTGSVVGLVDKDAPRSRSNSLFSNATASVLGRTSRLGSRPSSILALGEEQEPDHDADALSEWGVEKFLSKQERERIAAGQRSRAQSLAGSAIARPSFEQHGPTVTARKSIDVTRDHSNTKPDASRPSSEVVPATGAGVQDSKLELLAKIKLYRERQENLPPSEWDGPGPTASKDEVVEHIIASSDNDKRKSLRQASLSFNEPIDLTDTHEAKDVQAALPAAPMLKSSLQASDAVDNVTSESQPLVGSQFDAAGAEAPPSSSQSQAVAIPGAAALGTDPYSNISVEPLEMAGVGSWSRSASRRNSFLAGPLYNPQGQETMQMTDTGPSVSTAGMSGHDVLSTSPGPTPPSFGIARPPSRGWHQDQFSAFDHDLGPSPFAAALQAASPSIGGPLSEVYSNQTGQSAADGRAINFNSLTTRQLQTVARNSTFPFHLGINRDLLAEEEELDEQGASNLVDAFGQVPVQKRRRQSSADLTALAQDLAKTGGDNFEIQLGGEAAPDLSSANWGKPRKKWFRLSMMADTKGKPKKPKKTSEADGAEGDGESDAEQLQTATAIADQPRVDEDGAADRSGLYASEPSTGLNIDSAPAGQEDSDGIDDDYISPPRRGPLRPRGLAAHAPKTLIMPQPLQGTEFAPKLRLTDEMPTTTPPSADNRHSLHVPEGFVLHSTRGGLPPMRSLVVHSANGPQPMFAAKTGTKKAPTRLKAVGVDRLVQVPAAAPRGIGRRAAAPTTALFRNHLVQHDDEREGWGWEAGTRVDDIFRPERDADSDSDDKPLADIKKQGRTAKRAAKRLAKEKRKRKAARRIRRAKREEALKEGKSFKEAGVPELSPDEDLDLSSTTSEEEETGSESDSDLWATDDDKRWVDDSKPAGKLYGKSLLDIATERNTERKSKARFYGQVQLEDGETTMLQLDQATAAGSVLDDGASVAPSMARTFREKPVGYNDTRERMEAVFGADQIWAREMAKRQEEEARETQVAKEKAEAETAQQKQLEEAAKAKKRGGLFSRNRKGKKDLAANLGMSNASLVESTTSVANSSTPVNASAQGTDLKDSTEAGQPVRSQSPVQPPVISLDLGDNQGDRIVDQHGRKTPALLAGEDTAAEWLINSDVESEKVDYDEASSDDDVPLVQVKKKVASRPISFAAGLSLQPRADEGDSSDEELPLAALKQKRVRQSTLLGGGKLDLDFSSMAENPGREDKLDVSPSPVRPVVVEDDDSDEDLPLGQRHPDGDAALIAMRATLENQKRAAKEAKQAEKAQRRAARLSRQVISGNHNTETNGEHAESKGAADNTEDDSDDDDSEDDQPLGFVHPQAAIIAEQAALIRQLQEEKEQQQHQQRLAPSVSGVVSPSAVDVRSSVFFNGMSGLPSIGSMGNMGIASPRHSVLALPPSGPVMVGMPQLDGLPASSSGLPFAMPVATSMPIGMPVPPPMTPGSNIGMPTGTLASPMVPPMAMPMMTGAPQMANPMSMMLDPKTSSIHNWRTQVPTDATANVTPPGGSSAISSA